MKKRFLFIPAMLLSAFLFAATGFCAYHHEGEEDSARFLAVHQDKAGTKLDHCSLCHSGGSYESNGQVVNLGSCQWCHYSYGYDGSGNLDGTLNEYGRDYRANGRSKAAVRAIEKLDSDGDGYVNGVEITAVRYPGDENDDPGKIPAPYRIYSKAQLDAMAQHTQFLLMNTSRSGDFYAEYTGVPMEDLLNDAGMLDSATGIIVYAPDGWSNYHPLDPDPNPEWYHVRGIYPEAAYQYDVQADVALDPTDGWCDYSAPSCQGRNHLDSIVNQDGLKMILAFYREGQDLTPGVLNEDNKLDGEGPFRVVPPQRAPSPPDQSSKAVNQDVIWPYNYDWDHNAGAASRTATIIKVEPLPEGTTDIDILEAGWNYVDAEKIIIYGAIDPLPTIQQKQNELIERVRSSSTKAFKRAILRKLLLSELRKVRNLTDKGKYRSAIRELKDDVLKIMDGCIKKGSPDRNDWVTNEKVQGELYWAVNEVIGLLKIEDKLPQG